MRHQLEVGVDGLEAEPIALRQPVPAEVGVEAGLEPEVVHGHAVPDDPGLLVEADPVLGLVVDEVELVELQLEGQGLDGAGGHAVPGDTDLVGHVAAGEEVDPASHREHAGGGRAGAGDQQADVGDEEARPPRRDRPAQGRRGQDGGPEEGHQAGVGQAVEDVVEAERQDEAGHRGVLRLVERGRLPLQDERPEDGEDRQGDEQRGDEAEPRQRGPQPPRHHEGESQHHQAGDAGGRHQRGRPGRNPDLRHRAERQGAEDQQRGQPGLAGAGAHRSLRRRAGGVRSVAHHEPP